MPTEGFNQPTNTNGHCRFSPNHMTAAALLHGAGEEGRLGGLGGGFRLKTESPSLLEPFSTYGDVSVGLWCFCRSRSSLYDNNCFHNAHTQEQIDT